MNFHEVANVFPLLQGEEFEAFCQDIRGGAFFYLEVL